MRLDQCLAEVFPDYSRSKLQTWIKAGRVLVDGEVMKGREKLDGGEEIELDAEAERVIEYAAQEIPLDIKYEDESLLIVNKPAGLVVHPAVGNWDGTLVNALLNHAPQLETLPRAGIVHRIDKDTSGLLMVAKTLQAHNSLVEQLQERSIHREYLALVKGWMTAGGTVNAPIGRHPVDRKRNAVRRDGKEAITHYRLEQRFKRHTLIRCKLETGRTHQIRVHMATSITRWSAIRSTAAAFKCRPIAARLWPTRCATSSARRCMPPSWGWSIRKPATIANGSKRCRTTWPN